MNSIGVGSGSLPTSSPTYAPIGKLPVGLESSDYKDAALPPVEESAAVDKARADQSSAKVNQAKDQSGQNQSGASATPASGDLNEAELAQIRELANISRKVQAHEAAHAAVGGALAGAKSFAYVTGPDGVRYAVAGEVSIQFGQSEDPAVTLRNASQVRAAALAPADPSPQDLQVAGQAAQIIQRAQSDLANLRAAVQSALTSRNRSLNALRAFGEVQREPSDLSPLVDQRA